MFSENDFKFIPLVLALLAYLGAVRIAIRQRLSALLLDMHNLGDRAKWSRLAKHARGSSRALMLLIPADVMFVGVAFLLLCKLLGRPDGGSLTIAIESGIMIGGAWLLLLHLNEWILGYSPATEERRPPAARVPAALPKADKEDPFCTKLEYRCALVIPMLVLACLVGLSVSAKNPSKDAISHYELGRELHDQRRFDAAIVQHRHAAQIEPGIPSARQHYALAEAVAAKNANHSPLEALEQAIKIEERFGEKAKTEPAFE